MNGHARNPTARHAKILEGVDVELADRPKHARRCRSLQRERRDILRDVLDLHSQAGRVLPEPPQARIGRRPPVRLLPEPRHGAIVDHLAVLVAPRRVIDLAHRHLLHVARDHSVDETRRVGSGDEVLEEGRDVNERGRVADRVVLVLVMGLVHADRVVAGPLTVVERLAQRKGA